MPIEYDSKGWLRRAREHSSFKAATTMISDMQRYVVLGEQLVTIQPVS